MPGRSMQKGLIEGFNQPTARRRSTAGKLTRRSPACQWISNGRLTGALAEAAVRISVLVHLYKFGR